MRIFLFLALIYSVMIVFGVTSSQAQIAPPVCKSGDCVPKDDRSLNDIVGSVGSMDAEKIEKFMTKIEKSVDKEKLLKTIQKAVDQNAEIRNLVSIIQQYGVLTEIEIREVKPAD